MNENVMVAYAKKRQEEAASTIDTAAKPARALHPWDTAPAPIPESEIIETLEADIVIAGAGLSGLSAAARAAEQGADVIVLEKAATWSGRGGHIGALESKVMEALDIHIDKQQFVREWLRLAGNHCKEDLVWLFANESGKSVDWLLDLAEAVGSKGKVYCGFYKGPDYTEYPGTHMLTKVEGINAMGARLASHLLFEEAKKYGARFFFKTPAQQLEKENGRVTAVIAKSEDGYRRYKALKGVILATGDIGGDKEMLAAYAPIGLKPLRTTYAPRGCNTGDGHKMGLWAGGVLPEDESWPTMIHMIAYAHFAFAFLHVNTQGKRFMNEDNWVQAKMRQILRQPGNVDYAYSVFDANWLDDLERTIELGGGQFWDINSRCYGDGPWTRDCGVAEMVEYYTTCGLGFKADSIEELAEKMGVPKENLVKTVSRYNEMAAAGKDTDYGKRSELLTRIEKGPFYALKFGGSLLAVCDGLDVDNKLHVLDKDQNPIPGLWAVGNVSGGFYGVDYPVILNGNSHGRALTWGRLAAENIMKEEK